MKKKILGGIALLAIAAVAAWNVSLNSQSNELSAVSLANVEALAQESEGENKANTIVTQEGPDVEIEINSSTIAYYLCSTIVVDCLGKGSLDCVSGVFATSCYPVYKA